VLTRFGFEVEERHGPGAVVALDRCGEAAAYVAVEVDLGHGDLGTDDRSSHGELDVVLERLAERPVALVAVGIDGDLLDKFVFVQFVEVVKPSSIAGRVVQKASVSAPGDGVGGGDRRRVLGTSKPKVA
jgi:hypothetical protein